MATILVSGGTGLIGSALCKILAERGHTVHVLSRHPHSDQAKNILYFQWDPTHKEFDGAALQNVDGVIHLAGAGIADKRWTKARKKIIVDSRVDSALFLQSIFREAGRTLDFFITASGANYYGIITSEKVLTEQDPPGNDFLADCCVKWEGAAFEESIAGRVIALRTGVVLGSHDSALQRLAQPIRWGIGAALGSGKQYVPWIHISDLVDIYVKAVEDPKMTGPFNAVADEHLSNKRLMQTTANRYGRRIWLPNVPGFVMKLVFGEMANILLKGTRLSNDRIKSLGFNCRFPDLETALKDLIRTP